MVAFSIIPQWNLVEQQIKGAFSSDFANVRTVYAEIENLARLFSWESVCSWLGSHLRFPNIRTKVVSELNGTEEQIE